MLREFPEPVVPDDGLIMDVQACGICGSDIRRWQEGPPAGVDGIVPGHEAAGIIASVGRAVSSFSLGDRIAIAPDIHCGRCYYCQREWFHLCDHLKLIGISSGCPGALSEKLVLTGEILENGIVHSIPLDMPSESAALAEPCSSVLAVYEKLGSVRNAAVVVLGAGPIGCIHVNVARSNGARVIVSECNEDRKKLVKRFQPDRVIDPVREDVVGKVREFTDGVGADVVICANAVADTQQQAVGMVRKGGRVVFFGGLPKSSPKVLLDANRIHYGEIQITGAFSYHPSMHKMALDLLYRKIIPAEKIITHSFPLERIGEAFETAASGKGLKIIVRME
jgi:L-iditol 2-dehydrogenase